MKKPEDRLIRSYFEHSVGQVETPLPPDMSEQVYRKDRSLRRNLYSFGAAVAAILLFIAFNERPTALGQTVHALNQKYNVTEMVQGALQSSADFFTDLQGE